MPPQIPTLPGLTRVSAALPGTCRHRSRPRPRSRAPVTRARFKPSCSERPCPCSTRSYSALPPTHTSPPLQSNHCDRDASCSPPPSLRARPCPPPGHPPPTLRSSQLQSLRICREGDEGRHAPARETAGADVRSCSPGAPGANAAAVPTTARTTEVLSMIG